MTILGKATRSASTVLYANSRTSLISCSKCSKIGFPDLLQLGSANPAQARRRFHREEGFPSDVPTVILLRFSPNLATSGTRDIIGSEHIAPRKVWLGNLTLKKAD